MRPAPISLDLAARPGSGLAPLESDRAPVRIVANTPPVPAGVVADSPPPLVLPAARDEPPILIAVADGRAETEFETFWRAYPRRVAKRDARDRVMLQPGGLIPRQPLDGRQQRRNAAPGVAGRAS